MKTIIIKTKRHKQRDHLIKTGISRRGSGIHKLKKDKRKQNKDIKRLIEENDYSK